MSLRLLTFTFDDRYESWGAAGGAWLLKTGLACARGQGGEAISKSSPTCAFTPGPGEACVGVIGWPYIFSALRDFEVSGC